MVKANLLPSLSSGSMGPGYPLDNVIELGIDIATDYIAYRVQIKNPQSKLCELPAFHILPESSVLKVYSLTRKLCIEMEDEHKQFFHSVGSKLEITRANVKATFMSIAHGTFDGGVNWGRIISLFCFAGVFAQNLIDVDMIDLIPEICDWLRDVLDGHVKNWIKARGSWDKMIEHFSPSQKISGWSGIVFFGIACLLAGMAMSAK